MEKKSVYLGSEADDALVSQIRVELEKRGAIRRSATELGVGGQDTSIIEYQIGDLRLQIAMETYAGITLTGDDAIVQEFVRTCRSV